MSRKKVSFEEALIELETVISALETDLPLDDAVDQFEKGVKAVQECRGALGRAEGRITKLFEGSDGQFIEKNFGITMESLVGGESL